MDLLILEDPKQVELEQGYTKTHCNEIVKRQRQRKNFKSKREYREIQPRLWNLYKTSDGYLNINFSGQEGMG